MKLRTFTSPHKLQLCLSIRRKDGQGNIHASIHVFEHALALEFPFKEGQDSPRIAWTLFPGKKSKKK